MLELPTPCPYIPLPLPPPPPTVPATLLRVYPMLLSPRDGGGRWSNGLPRDGGRPGEPGGEMPMLRVRWYPALAGPPRPSSEGGAPLPPTCVICAPEAGCAEPEA